MSQIVGKADDLAMKSFVFDLDKLHEWSGKPWHLEPSEDFHDLADGEQLSCTDDTYNWILCPALLFAKT